MKVRLSTEDMIRKQREIERLVDSCLRRNDNWVEAAGPECRKPAAVFMSLIKKELGYAPKAAPPRAERSLP